MQVVNVEPKERGTVAKVTRSTTAGLASAYQKTGISNLGLSAVETTGGFLLIDVAALPWYSPSLPSEADAEAAVALNSPSQDELDAAYKAMAKENSRIAEESFALALESWPPWEE